MENYLYPYNDRNVSEDVMIMVILVQVSRFLCWNRVTVEGEKGDEFPMLYFFNFALSGAYKDEIIDSLVGVIQDCLDKQNELIKSSFEFREKEFFREVALLKGEEKKIFVRDNRPKRFRNEFTSGSDVALHDRRKACELAEIGSIHFTQDEFLDYYQKKDSTTSEIFRVMKSVYSKGDSKPNDILGEFRGSVRGTPMTMLLYGSTETMQDDHKIMTRFLSTLSTGMAKRANVLFDDSTTRVKRTYEEEQYDQKLYRYSKGDIKKIWNKMFNAVVVKDNETAAHLQYDFTKIKTSDDVKRLRSAYKNKCYDDLKTEHNDIVKKELQDRPWRAFRLAVCIAMIEHPERLIVEKKDYEFAMNRISKWSKQFKSFLLKDKKSDVDIVWEHILANPKTCTSELGKVGKARYSKQREAIIDELKLMADENNKLLLIERGRGSTRYYTIEDMPEHKEVEGFKAIYSQGDTNNKEETHMVTKKCEWGELYKVIQANQIYSDATFSDEYRRGKSWEARNNLIIMDFDNEKDELSVSEAFKKFEGFQCLMVATKSHQKDKKDYGVADRFRMIFPTESMIGITVDQYKNVMANIIKEFDLKPHNLDHGALNDPVKMYFGHRGKKKYVEGKLMNWKVFDVYKESAPIEVSMVKSKNTIEDRQTFTLNRGEVVDVQGAVSLARQTNKTVPCFANCHQDKEPSAFFQINKNGNLHYHCSACGVSQFYDLT